MTTSVATSSTVTLPVYAPGRAISRDRNVYPEGVVTARPKPTSPHLGRGGGVDVDRDQRLIRPFPLPQMAGPLIACLPHSQRSPCAEEGAGRNGQLRAVARAIEGDAHLEGGDASAGRAHRPSFGEVPLERLRGRRLRPVPRDHLTGLRASAYPIRMKGELHGGLGHPCGAEACRLGSSRRLACKSIALSNAAFSPSISSHTAPSAPATPPAE